MTDKGLMIAAMIIAFGLILSSGIYEINDKNIRLNKLTGETTYCSSDGCRE